MIVKECFTVGPELSYHECTIHTLEGSADKVYIGLSDVDYGDQRVHVDIVITGFNHALIDEQPACIWQKPSDEGEILTLEIDKNNLLVIVEWEEYHPVAHYIMSYELFGGVIDVTIV